MPSQAGFTVQGARQLRRTLKAAGQDLGDLKAAHAAAGAVVLPRAKGKAPRRSGALAGNIRASAAASSLTLRAGGARVPYAGPIHWGWAKRNIRPQPWIYEEINNSQPFLVRVYEDAVGRIVNRIRGV